MAEGVDLVALDAGLAHEEVQQEAVVLAGLAVLLEHIAAANAVHLDILVADQELRGIHSPGATAHHAARVQLPQ